MKMEITYTVNFQIQAQAFVGRDAIHACNYPGPHFKDFPGGGAFFEKGPFHVT
jgi:hypothetical protein